MEVITTLGVIGTVLMIVEFAQPIQWIKEYYGVDQAANSKKLYKIILQKMLGCCLCLGFWVGTIFYLNFYWGIVIAFASEITYRLYVKLTQYI